MNLPIIYQKSVGKYGKLCGFMKKTNFKNLQKPMEIKSLKVYNNSQIKKSSGQVVNPTSEKPSVYAGFSGYRKNEISILPIIYQKN